MKTEVRASDDHTFTLGATHRVLCSLLYEHVNSNPSVRCAYIESPFILVDIFSVALCDASTHARARESESKIES